MGDGRSVQRTAQRAIRWATVLAMAGGFALSAGAAFAASYSLWWLVLEVSGCLVLGGVVGWGQRARKHNAALLTTIDGLRLTVKAVGELMPGWSLDHLDPDEPAPLHEHDEQCLPMPAQLVCGDGYIRPARLGSVSGP